MTDPNFFIVGAPKCGTTALAQYLGEHSRVFISEPKEPLYFLDSKDKHRKFTDLDHYRLLFKNADGFSAVGEASVWYLYSQTARQAIFKTNPNAKIIIMTREPADFVASLHSQLLFSGQETEPNLSRAWIRENERFSDHPDITIESNPNWRTMYAELIQFQKYIDFYKNTFGADNVFTLSQEELNSDTEKTYKSVLHFLNVPYEERVQFQRINSNKVHRSHILKKILHWIRKQRKMIAFARSIKSRLGIKTFGIYGKLESINAKGTKRDPLMPSLREEINGVARYNH